MGLLNGPIFALAVSAGPGGLVTYAGWYFVASWLSSLVVSGAWRGVELEGAPSFALTEPRCQLCVQTHAGGQCGCFGTGPGQPETRGRRRRKQCLKAHGSEESRGLPGGDLVDLVPGRRLAGMPGR
jgi:hypothetical protein